MVQFNELHIKGFTQKLLSEAVFPKKENSYAYTRADLPQFNNVAELDSFAQTCKDTGTRVCRGTKLARDLMPSQGEYDFSKVVDIVQDWTQQFPPVLDPIAIDRDGYIIDGHHRWMALMYTNPNMEVPVVQFMNKLPNLLLNKVPRWQDTQGTMGESVKMDEENSKPKPILGTLSAVVATCTGCKKRITKGQNILYFPESKRYYCETCYNSKFKNIVKNLSTTEKILEVGENNNQLTEADSQKAAEISKLIKALDTFRDAHIKLLTAWDMAQEAGLEDDWSHPKYPFGVDFAEYSVKVKNWSTASVHALKSLKV